MIAQNFKLCVCLDGAFCQAPYSDEGSAPVPVGSDTVVQMSFFFQVSVRLRMEVRRGSNVIRYRFFLSAECGSVPGKSVSGVQSGLHNP